jgi:putative membrane protein
MTCRYLSSTAIVTILVLSATNAFAAKNATEFITDAIQGDNSEIMLGQMAEEKGGSQQVKDFGKTLVADHSAAKAEASTVAKALGVTPPDTPMAEAKDEHEKLSKMSGAGFDQEFANYMVTDHKKDIQEFQDQVKGNNGQTSALASKQLPLLQRHLKMAQAIAEGASQNGTAAGTLSDTLTQESPDQWRASKLAGVAVYGPEKKDVGKITDVLLSKDGKAEFVIVGVGGFLGIGEKDVAVPFNQVKFTDQPMNPSARDKATGGAGPASGTTEAPGSPAPNGTPPRVLATDRAAPAAPSTGGSTADSGAATPRSASYPDHGIIDMTVDQLKNAPTFHFAR